MQWGAGGGTAEIEEEPWGPPGVEDTALRVPTTASPGGQV